MKQSVSYLRRALFTGLLALTAVGTLNAEPRSMSGDVAAQSQLQHEYRYDRAIGAGNGNQTGNTYRYRHRERSQWSGGSTNRSTGSSGWSRQGGGGVSGAARGRR